MSGCRGPGSVGSGELIECVSRCLSKLRASAFEDEHGSVVDGFRCVATGAAVKYYSACLADKCDHHSS